MSYTVFARKYRPQGFDEVVGQEAIVTTLKNALKQGRVAHAYLFTGPRGVGKTSIARILAKALNCHKGPTDKPCNKCDICLSISEGRDMDVLEIDGASNRGIDEVRAIRENVKYLPSRSRYKIYIIDEVHMLTREAFNALLKTLEEPPPHVKFFFATTAPNKLPETVQSRCQRFDLKNVTPSDIVRRLEQIAAKEGLNIEEEALRAIARYSRGGLRDAQSLLDQLGAFSEGRITPQDVRALLGTVSEEKIEAMVDCFIRKDAPGALKIAHEVINQGGDLGVFIDQLVWYLRDLLVVSTCGYNAGLLENPWRGAQLLERQTKDLSGDTLMYMIQTLTEVKRRATDDLQERIFLETAVVRMARMENLEPLEGIIQRLEELERRISRETICPGLTGPVGSAMSEPKGPAVRRERAEGAAPSKANVREGTKSLPSVDEVWKGAMEHLRSAKRPLWTRLRECRLIRLEGGEAVIAFPKGRPFSKRSVEQSAEAVRAIEDSIEGITGRRFRLRVELSEDVPVIMREESTGQGASGDKAQAKTLDKSKVEKVASFFEGEILE